ncbi:MAG: AraC family transcriptional regulator [Shimia sp.]|uniref:helix-turn-helix domain-containing protein n=1 Tax=Shimia sp. TaxID=1954381 RepID=UPI0025E20E53|nr:AraC family transcriptional regulator [Shimia sp.]MCH2068698.1 AraC family transcriptional regulator [Shimia sp.]
MAQPCTAFYRGATHSDKINWFRRADLPEDNVFEGLVTATEFREGLGIHTLNAKARRSFETKTQRIPGAILNCFLEGATEAWLDDKPMELGRKEHGPVKFSLSATDETLRFQRRSAPGEYVRKVSIQMSHEWLHEQNLKLPQPAVLQNKKQYRADWNATPKDVKILENLASMNGFHSPISRLQGEAMVLELVASSFKNLSAPETTIGLTPREISQLKRVEDLIQSTGPLPDLAALAKAGGLSLSSLRRLTQKAHGCAPLSYARTMRLSMAKELLETSTLSVSNAAEIAGFSTPENFSTAFRRAFGISPSAAKHR